MRNFNAIALAAALILLNDVANAHPSHGFESNPMPQSYVNGTMSYGSDWNLGDLVFPDSFPSAAEMTEAEKYMIAGSTDSEFGFPLPNWIQRIFETVHAHEMATGTVPAALDMNILNDLGMEDASRAEEYLSPLTGEFPRLDAAEFSRGNVYIRKLTDAEIQHFTTKDGTLNQIVNHGTGFNPVVMDTTSVRLVGGVYYMRVYGETDVIYTGLKYIAAPGF